MLRARAIVADDSPGYLATLERAVTRHPGLELAGSAVDGTQALILIERLAPDVALLDDRMPGLRGIEVAEEVARRRGATTVVLVTADAAEDLVRRAQPLGVRVFDKMESARVLADTCARLAAADDTDDAEGCVAG